MRIFRLCVAALAVATGTEVAAAADLPARPTVVPVVAMPAPAPEWAGFYVGVNGGMGWAHTNVSGIVVEVLGADVPTDGSMTQNGAVFGGHIGYNWQYGAVVTGIEVDADWTHLEHHGNLLATGGNDGVETAVIREDARMDMLASVRGRLGYSWGANLLFYGTGGFAIGHNKLSLAPTTTNTSFLGGATASNLDGWVVGAGVEYRLIEHVLLRAEYLYYDFDSHHFILDATASPLSARTSVNVVRGGITYKF